MSGDYLAIVTLFFSQIFLELTLNFDRLGVDLTGGPNGIAGVDPVPRSSAAILEPDVVLLLLLVLIALIVTCSTSSSARARDAPGGRLRDDPLAAEIMTVPIGRLKLMAFASGAAIAGSRAACSRRSSSACTR